MFKVHSYLCVGLGIALVSAAQPANARDVRRLAPTSKWVLEYADENCRLARTFGQGADQVILALDQFTPGDNFKVAFAGETFSSRNVRLPSNPQIRFGPNEASDRLAGYAALLGKLPAFVASGAQRIAPLTESEMELQQQAARNYETVDFPPIGPEREKAANWLELSELLNFDLILETGPMDRPLNALRECSWDTVRSWGFNVEQQKSLSRRAKKKGSGAWFSSDDYPSRMLEQNQQGMISFRVIVDEKGNPESCTIQRSTRPKDFR